MASNQMWQTDFTYLKVIGWGWFHLSTILDDVSRQVIGWSNMRAEDVTETLDIALAASGRDSARVFTNRGFSATMDRPASPKIWPNTVKTKASNMFAARRCIPRPKARSNVGTRP